MKSLCGQTKAVLAEKKLCSFLKPSQAAEENAPWLQSLPCTAAHLESQTNGAARGQPGRRRKIRYGTFSWEELSEGFLSPRCSGRTGRYQQQGLFQKSAKAFSPVGADIMQVVPCKNTLQKMLSLVK